MATAERPRQYETIAEAAARVGVNTKTIRRRIAAGQLTGYRLGHQVLRLDPLEVDAMLRPVPAMTA